MLKRQLKKHIAELNSIPKEFIDAINKAYYKYDTDRDILKRSLDLSTEELIQANSDMLGIFRAIPDVFIKFNKEGVIVEYKAISVVDVPISAKDFIGENFQDILPSELRSRFQEVVNIIMDTNSVGEIEFPLTIQDQEIFYESRILSSSEDEFIAVLRNITARRQEQDELFESRERYRTLTENTYDLILETDFSAVYLYASPNYHEILGYKPAELLGKKIFEDIHPEDRPVVKAEFERAFISGAPGNAVFRYKHKDGRWIWLESAGKPYKDAQGKLRGVIVSRDITERKLKESQIQELYTELRRSQDDLLSILHQLRVGSLIVDENGVIQFVSNNFLKLIGSSQKEFLGIQWEKALPVKEEIIRQVRDMAELEPRYRKKIRANIQSSNKKDYWAEVEIQNHPQNPKRKIFLFYDITDILSLQQKLQGEVYFQNLIGKSKEIQLLHQQVLQLATLDNNLLICGETGTGKELVAKSIHNLSKRKDRPFITVNCSGLTESLLASQLFGYKRGYFPGLSKGSEGSFEAAKDGIIFLDDIGNLPASIQAKLIRVIDKRETTRLGETKIRKVNCRIIASTNQDLTADGQKGIIRPDLFYRIKEAVISLPPLRDRREDIPVLSRYFIDQLNMSLPKEVKNISTPVIQILLKHDWPGNVRELKNVIDFAANHCKRGIIRPEDLPDEILTEHNPYSDYINKIKEEDRKYVLDAIIKSRGSKTEAARILGISRATLYRRLKALNITLDKRFEY